MKITLACLTSALLVGSAALMPLRAEEQRSKAPGVSAEAKVDLNTASERALAAVPVIGADAARAIIAARPFSSIDELDRVQGLSAERLEQIRAKAVVSAPPEKKPLGQPTGEKQRLGSPTSMPQAPTGRVNLNTAPVATLAAIPVIGPELAPKLVAARPFKSLDDLARVKGLTAEQLEQIRGVLTVETR
jgi:DNA uptake protein ComE-like DNA-binding protein